MVDLLPNMATSAKARPALKQLLRASDENGDGRLSFPDFTRLCAQIRDLQEEAAEKREARARRKVGFAAEEVESLRELFLSAACDDEGDDTFEGDSLARYSGGISLPQLEALLEGASGPLRRQQREGLERLFREVVLAHSLPSASAARASPAPLRPGARCGGAHRRRRCCGHSRRMQRQWCQCCLGAAVL